MTKSEFLEILSQELKRRNVADAADIAEEYKQHFAFKLADGYSEEEIAAKLGNPKELASQYASVSVDKNGGKKIVTVIGLGAADTFFGILFVLLCAWEIVMGAMVIAFGTLSGCLICGSNGLSFFSIPEIPYNCGFILGLAFLALAVLSAMGTIYFFRFIGQLTRSFGRFHKNTLSAVNGKAVLPSLPVYPQFTAKNRRLLRLITTIAAIAFAVCFVSGYISCVITSGSFEFWHTWGWFGYGK